MPRWKQTFDEELGKHVMVPIGVSEAPKAGAVRGDIPDFVSPIDGTIVRGNKGMRDHCKKHNVVPSAEFSNEWYAKKEKERESVFSGKHSPEATFARKREINEIINHLERKR